MSLAPRCIAPVEPTEAGPRAFRERGVPELLCGEPATAERVVEGLACPLCAAHAAEIDAEEHYPALSPAHRDALLGRYPCSSSRDDDGTVRVWAGPVGDERPGDGTAACRDLVLLGLLGRGEPTDGRHVYPVTRTGLVVLAALRSEGTGA